MKKYQYEDNLCLIKTNKYKSISVYLYFAKEYNLKEKLALYLLGYFMGETSIKYQKREEMLKAKDNLYGASVSISNKNKANLMQYIVKYTFINPRFLKDVSMNDFLSFFKEFFFNIYFSEERFEENKKIYKDYIFRMLDKPSSFATNRALEILADENEAMGIYVLNHIDEIDEINLDDVKKVYADLFKEFSLDIFVSGDYDESLVEYFKTLKSPKTYHLKNECLDFDDLKEITETKDASQSSLNVYFKTPYHKKSKDYYGFFLGNALLGGVPTSLLFDEVREKQSLCYYIAVQDYKQEGLVRIFTAINSKNKDKVIKEIEKQMKRLVDMDYDLSLLEQARSLLIDSITSIEDDLDAYTTYLYTNHLNNEEISFEEYIDNLNSVTREDIAGCFKNYKHVLTYMLEGTK